jgi:predicted ABC-type ATPase
MSVPRLRMFAGPNGSGKSTIKGVISRELLGVYLNPDDMQKEMEATGVLELSAYGVEISEDEIVRFFGDSALLRKAGLVEAARGLSFSEGRLSFSNVAVNAYFASVAADFLRQKLLERRVSLSFETVMSSPDKVALLAQAQALGYRTYLYYVATDDPAINVARVHARVQLGGHDVPEEKIAQRYYRSLDLLLGAIRHTSRAYLFDNSREGDERMWVAEVTDGRDLELKCDPMPRWFQAAVWDKIQVLSNG